MPSKYMKKYSSSLIINEMQSNTTKNGKILWSVDKKMKKQWPPREYKLV